MHIPCALPNRPSLNLRISSVESFLPTSVQRTSDVEQVQYSQPSSPPQGSPTQTPQGSPTQTPPGIPTQTTRGIPTPTPKASISASEDSKPPLAAVIGGGVGGGIVLLILIVILCLCILPGSKKEKQEQADSAAGVGDVNLDYAVKPDFGTPPNNNTSFDANDGGGELKPVDSAPEPRPLPWTTVPPDNAVGGVGAPENYTGTVPAMTDPHAPPVPPVVPSDHFVPPPPPVTGGELPYSLQHYDPYETNRAPMPVKTGYNH